MSDKSLLDLYYCTKHVLYLYYSHRIVWCLTDRSDSDGELAVVREEALAAGAAEAIVCEHWARGSAGAALLAAELAKACEAARAKATSNFQFLYPLEVWRVTCLLSPALSNLSFTLLFCIFVLFSIVY